MRRSKNNQNSQKFEKIKGYFYIIVSIILIASLMRNITRIRKADERIDKARDRVSKLEEQREELQARLDESQSQIYLESQLRDGLGLSKEDEIIIVLPEEDVLRRIAPDIKEEIEIETPTPVWRRWLALFTTLED